MKIFQPIISGSFTTSGSVFLKGLTSVPQSNVVLINATTGQLYYTSSAAIGGGGGGSVDTSSLLTTASFNAYTGSNTSQFAGTSSFTLLTQTATNAQSSSNFVITSTLQLDATLIDYSTVSSTIVGGNNLYTRATGSYTATFMKYTVSKGTNSRAGEFIVNWNDSLPVETTDVSTKDIGSTVDIVFDSVLVGGNIEINANAASSGWKIKSLATFI